MVWLLCAFVTGAWLNPTVPGLDPLHVSAGSLRGDATGTPTAGVPARPAAPTPAAPTPDAVTPDAVTPAAPTPIATNPAAAADDLPACRYADQPAAPDQPGDWTLAVVDTIVRLPKGYRPSDLVSVSRAGLAGVGSVRAIIIDDLRDLAAAAKAAGRTLAVQSAFRSETRQAAVFAGWVASHGAAAARTFSARPGHSEHQLGTALDFRAAGGPAPWTTPFGDTKAGRWLAAHAATFGFVMSYPDGAEATTCYGSEPWHFRWVGRDTAAAISTSGLTPRAWLWAHEAAR